MTRMTQPRYFHPPITDDVTMMMISWQILVFICEILTDSSWDNILMVSLVASKPHTHESWGLLLISPTTNTTRLRENFLENKSLKIIGFPLFHYIHRHQMSSSSWSPPSSPPSSSSSLDQGNYKTDEEGEEGEERSRGTGPKGVAEGGKDILEIFLCV